MCRNFTYEVVGQRRKLKAINVILFFDVEFFRYFFRVLREASSSWLKFVHAFQKYPVFWGALTRRLRHFSIEIISRVSLHFAPALFLILWGIFNKHCSMSGGEFLPQKIFPL
jgi:hypothetical protein